MRSLETKPTRSLIECGPRYLIIFTHEGGLPSTSCINSYNMAAPVRGSHAVYQPALSPASSPPSAVHFHCRRQAMLHDLFHPKQEKLNPMSKVPAPGMVSSKVSSYNGHQNDDTSRNGEKITLQCTGGSKDVLLRCHACHQSAIPAGCHFRNSPIPGSWKNPTPCQIRAPAFGCITLI